MPATPACSDERHRMDAIVSARDSHRCRLGSSAGGMHRPASPSARTVVPTFT